MVGSFIILAIVIIIRVIVGTLLTKFSWLSQCIPYIDYSLYGLAGVFALFVIIAVVRAILTVGRK